jgi:hypothetical protein
MVSPAGKGRDLNLGSVAEQTDRTLTRTRDIFAKAERDIKRPLSERERAAIGGLVLADRLPMNHRKRKRSLRRTREACRLVEIGLKAK